MENNENIAADEVNTLNKVTYQLTEKAQAIIKDAIGTTWKRVAAYMTEEEAEDLLHDMQVSCGIQHDLKDGKASYTFDMEVDDTELAEMVNGWMAMINGVFDAMEVLSKAGAMGNSIARFMTRAMLEYRQQDAEGAEPNAIVF